MIRNQQVLDYWPSDGVNLAVDPNVIPDTQCVSCENLTFLFGEQRTLTKRLGVKLNTATGADPLTAGAFLSLPGVAPIPVLAATNSLGDALYGGTPPVQMTGPTLAADGTWSMVEYAGTVYMFNGNAVYTTTNGTTYVEATLPANLPDTPLGGFIYLDRMYYRFSSRSSYANSIYYSDVTLPLSMSFTTQNLTVGQFLGESVTGFGYLSWASAQTGPIGSLGIWKNNGMWVLSGDPILASSALSQTSDITGCVNANTVTNTPAGTIWVSPDNVYLNQNGTNLPIGRAIFPSVLTVLAGSTQSQMFAVFHNNFYKLYMPDGDGNIIGYWYNCLSHGDPETGWYGPMTGIDYTFMVTDPTDVLWGGDGSGNYYQLDAAQYDDNGTGYEAILISKVFDEGQFSLYKRYFIMGIEGDAAGAGTLTLQPFFDGVAGSFYYLPYGSVQSQWDVATWDVSTFAGPDYYNQKVYLAPPQVGHNVQFTVTQTDEIDFNIERLALIWSPSRKVA